MDEILLVGAGGHCKSVIDVARRAGRSLLGILDRPGGDGGMLLDCPIIGTDDDMSRYADRVEFLVSVGAIGCASTRIRLYDRIKSVGGRMATLISPSACVSCYAEVGDGTVVMHRAVINASAVVGVNCIINTGADIEHDTTIGDHTHISTGAMINGGCRIGSGVFVGSGAVLAQGVSVADGAVIGAGAVVLRSILAPGTYCGIVK